MSNDFPMVHITLVQFEQMKERIHTLTEALETCLEASGNCQCGACNKAKEALKQQRSS